ncbi:unnamed protein product [Rotaria sp. Silwood2]|nr:unnamed protein product [Rotaria sp. Silwood2]CAF4200213.1 unnamed protein product [Rotaria sp. Silwood2]
MSMINIKSTTWFDFLPIEIIVDIFNYLSNNDIIYTFFYFNQRFNNLLLQNQCYFNYLEFPTRNLEFWRNIFSIIGSRIEFLNINTINFSLSLKYFPNIKSLILSSPIDVLDEQLKSILESEQFQKIHSFKIKENRLYFDRLYDNYLNNQDYLIKKILNDQNSLKIFQYSLITLPLSLIGISNLKINFNLYSLTLILTDFRDIFTLISYTPNLTYLNVQLKPPYRFQELIHKINIKLKQLHLKLSDNETREYPLSNDVQLFNGIKQFSSSLICLSLNLVGLDIETRNEIRFNSIKLQQFLESMIELKQFHLYAKLNKDPIDIDNILSSFSGKFWFDHNLSFGMHGRYFYTLPFYFNDLLEFYEGFDGVQSNSIEILETNPRMWYHVKSIELLVTYNYNLNFVKELKIKMPKLTLIKFGNIGFSSTHKTVNLCQEEKFDVQLDNVTTIEFTHGSIENKKEWLINVTPNLKYLFLWFTELSSIDNQLASILTKRIQQLNISTYIELEQLTMISDVYFSNVQYIIFGLNDGGMKPQDYAAFIMKILRNFQNLKTLIIYIIPISCFYIELHEIIQNLDMNEIINNYQVQQFREYCLFSKKSS